MTETDIYNESLLVQSLEEKKNECEIIELVIIDKGLEGYPSNPLLQIRYQQKLLII